MMGLIATRTVAVEVDARLAELIEAIGLPATFVQTTLNKALAYDLNGHGFLKDEACGLIVRETVAQWNQVCLPEWKAGEAFREGVQADLFELDDKGRVRVRFPGRWRSDG